MLRVAAETDAASGQLSLSVYFNPMLPETGFVGNSSDAFRVPQRIAPRLVVRDAAPLAPGGVMLLAGGAPARADYVSALPLAVM